MALSKEELDALVDQILRNRAERFDVPAKEPASQTETEPLYLAAAIQRAGREGTSPEAVLRELLGNLGQNTYPTPGCLTPDEIRSLGRTETSGETLSEERLAHAEACRPCAALLAASTASEQRVEHFKRQMDLVFAEASLAVNTAPALPLRGGARPAGSLAKQFVEKHWPSVLAGVAVGAILVLLGFGLVNRAQTLRVNALRDSVNETRDQVRWAILQNAKLVSEQEALDNELRALQSRLKVEEAVARDRDVTLASRLERIEAATKKAGGRAPAFYLPVPPDRMQSPTVQGEAPGP